MRGAVRRRLGEQVTCHSCTVRSPGGGAHRLDAAAVTLPLVRIVVDHPTRTCSHKRKAIGYCRPAGEAPAGFPVFPCHESGPLITVPPVASAAAFAVGTAYIEYASAENNHSGSCEAAGER